MKSLEKLELERFRSEGIDYDLAHPTTRWRELLADLRYLSLSGYPRLKEGKKWGDWTLEDIERYFATIVNTLRKECYFPLLPPDKDDPSYHTSYWELYRRAERKGLIKVPPPSEEEAKRWDEERAKIIKWEDDRSQLLKDLHDKLPDSFIIVPNWASISGSLVYGQHEPHDIDVILRTNAPSGSLLKLQRALQVALGKIPIQFSVEPEGPTWSYLELYDLVAIKRPFRIERLAEPEFAEAFYKSLALHLPDIRWGQPIKHYDVAGEFYYPDEVRLAWDKWARRLVERGEEILIQPKYDGIRLHIHFKGDAFHVFTEKGNDQAHAFPSLQDALKQAGFKKCILDCEFVQAKDARTWKPISRTEMTWMGTAKEPKIVPITVFIHDAVMYGGKNICDWPYSERLELLKELIPRPKVIGRYRLYVSPTWSARSWKAFQQGIEKAVQARKLSSEGAMLKVGSFIYDPEEARTDIAKLKRLIELDCLVLGYRKIPLPKPQGEHWTEEEARKALPKSLQESNTYQCRLALLDEETGDLVPIETRHKLTEKDLELKWNEKDQQWEGTSDPSYWTMFKPFQDRAKGEYAFGLSYNISLDEPPKPGDVLTVAPMELTPFKDEEGWHLTWQHPIPRSLKKGGLIGTIQAALIARKKDPEQHKPWASLLRRPRWVK
ncbi:MAG: hypothetical protein ABC596_05700 [Candidatus Methanosuratincola petrocarbonis]